MRVCDKCSDIQRSTQEVNIVLEDEWFDLCQKHIEELRKFLKTKEKPKRKILSKKAA